MDDCFIETKQVYSEPLLLEAKLSLLSQTKMVDHAKAVFLQLNPSSAPPADFVHKLSLFSRRVVSRLYSLCLFGWPPLFQAERRSTVVAELKALQEACRPLLLVVEDADLCLQLRDQGTFTLDNLHQQHQASAKQPQTGDCFALLSELKLLFFLVCR